MPVFRTPDGRIVEETTLVKPPGARPGQDVPGEDPGRDAADRDSRATVHEAPTVLGRPGSTTGAPTKPVDGERTKLAGAVPSAYGRSEAATPAGASGEAEVDPVAGWLVVVDGPGVGRDVRIGVGRNELGRSRENRIPLPFGDSRISRRGHLWVNYDPRHRVFSVAPGTGANLAYLDDVAIEERMPLAAGATIAVGKTVLRFIAFCGDHFSWPDE